MNLIIAIRIADKRNILTHSPCFHYSHGGLFYMSKNPAAKAPTKVEVYNNIATATGLTKKQVAAVLDALTGEISKAITTGPGVFQLPGLLKIMVVVKPATKRRQVRNPATGEMIWAEPKPARKVVKVRALKSLKDMIA